MEMVAGVFLVGDCSRKAPLMRNSSFVASAFDLGPALLLRDRFLLGAVTPEESQ